MTAAPDLRFAVLEVAPDPRSLVPMLHFKLQVIDDSGTAANIRGVDLRCQLRIEPARRRYTQTEQQRLAELFGEPSQWGQSARPMLWTQTGVMVPAFTGRTEVNLPVPCTFDFNVVGTKFFHALENGEAPLSLLFSGLMFHEAADGRLQTAPVSWNNQAQFRLPVRVWQEMMQTHYPNTAWIALRRDAFDDLYEYKRRHALPTWEATIEALIALADQAAHEVQEVHS